MSTPGPCPGDAGAPRRPSVAEFVAAHRTIVCVGTGGVGKTTVAATLALAGALAGRRAMVLTIDPARQLARALGLERLELEPQAVVLDGAQAVTDHAPAGGSLSAAMLDQQGAWDAFIRRHAPEPEVAQRLLGNSFYRRLSTSFAGSMEFMAIEEMCRLEESGTYDLLVIDTPPAAHAMDFLRAPARLESLLQPEVAAWLARPYRSWRDSLDPLLSLVGSRLQGLLEGIAGGATLEQISAFFFALRALFGDVSTRVERTRRLLRDAQTSFVLVTSPELRARRQVEDLLGVMGETGVHWGGTIVNRVVPDFSATEADIEVGLQQLARAACDEEAREWLGGVWRRARQTTVQQQGILGSLAELTPGARFFAQLPELAQDAHSLGDVATLARELLEPAGVVRDRGALAGAEPAWAAPGVALDGSEARG